MRIFASALVLLVLSSFVFADQTDRLQAKIVTDEAEAVLEILASRKANKPVTLAQWDKLFRTEGYVRLKKREASLKRDFTDDEFKAFVMSDALLARYEALAASFDRWKKADINKIAAVPLRYLPKGAKIRAKVYPMIKPKENSFVFEVKTDPAIFVYLDPAMPQAEYDNLMAHELHHIGFATACPAAETEAWIGRLPAGPQKVYRWLGAFGEGFAMLAAAGGAEIHPHETSSSSDRARWDSDVKNFDADLAKVEAFFFDLAAGKLSDDAELEQARSFYGIQGPWYTVGWKMAAVIEKNLGRETLIDCFCDQRKLLKTFNRAASLHKRKTGETMRTWSTELLEKLEKPN